MNDNEKHASLLQYGRNDVRKKFSTTGQKDLHREL